MTNCNNNDIIKEWNVSDYKMDTSYFIIEHINKATPNKKLLFIKTLDSLLTAELRPTTKSLLYGKWNVVIENKENFMINSINYEVTEINVGERNSSASVKCFYLKGQGIILALFDHGLKYRLIKISNDKIDKDYSKLIERIEESKVFFPLPPPLPISTL
jgi:hypothetical protein